MLLSAMADYTVTIGQGLKESIRFLGQSFNYSNTFYSGYFYGICRVPL